MIFTEFELSNRINKKMITDKLEAPQFGKLLLIKNLLGYIKTKDDKKINPKLIKDSEYQLCETSHSIVILYIELEKHKRGLSNEFERKLAEFDLKSFERKKRDSLSKKFADFLKFFEEVRLDRGRNPRLILSGQRVMLSDDVIERIKKDFEFILSEICKYLTPYS